MTMNLIKIAHITIFSVIIIGCLAEITTGGILLGNFNKHAIDPDAFSSLIVRIRYLVFCGIWSTLFSFIYILGICIAPGHLLFSLISHLAWLGVTMILFVSGSAALATEIKGQDLPHQERLEILKGFAWTDSILLAAAFVFVLVVGLGRRNGLTANLLASP